MADEGLFPLPVVLLNVTIRIHTFWLRLFNADPKSTVMGVLANFPGPKAVVKGEGVVVVVVNKTGLSPTP